MGKIQRPLSGETQNYRPTTFLLTLIALLAFLPAPEPLAGGAEPESSAFHASDLAVIRLASPQQFALLLHEPEEAPRLYKVGDLLAHPDKTARLLEVERIESDRMVLHDRATGRRWSLQTSQGGSGWDGLFFLGTVSLTEIQYRFEASNQIMREAPVVLSLAGPRAVLIQQVPSIRAEGQRVRSRGVSPPAPGQPGDRANALALSTHKIDEETYEIDKRALAPTLNRLSERLTQGLRDITRTLLNRGPLLPVQTSVGDGVLTKTGFTVTQPKTARTFGIEVGDTIVSLNGKPVSSPLNAWWAFQETFIRDRTTTVRVDLVRAGKPLTKIYHVK